MQNAYNLVNRTYETGSAEITLRENVSLLAYSPLAFGLLSGKYLSNATAPGRLTLFPGFAQRYTKANVQPAVAAYAELARANDLTPVQLALGFVASRPFVASTIIGATTLDEYRKYVEKDAALERRFQKVLVGEPSVEDTIAILRGLKERYEVHHGVEILSLIHI